MSGPDCSSGETEEQLTDQERALIDVTQAVLSRSASPGWAALTKLLRLHDRLRARVEELEQTVERVETLIDCTVSDSVSALDLIRAIGRDGSKPAQS
jgi:hypothetical protein